jgi:magnesium-transporting ATPase (P-type)
MSVNEDPQCPPGKEELVVFNTTTVAVFILTVALALMFTLWLLFNFRGMQSTVSYNGQTSLQQYDRGFLIVMLLFFVGVVTTTGFATWFQKNRADKINNRKNMTFVPTIASGVVILIAFLYHYKVLGRNRTSIKPVKFILPISILAGATLTMCVFALLQ